MSTKRKKEQPPRLPYRFNLPGDIVQVKIWAMVQALENAFLAIRDNQRFEARTLPVLAWHSCENTAAWCEDGKQGTNDMALYRQTYTDAFLAHYPVVHQKLLSGEIAIDRATPDAERIPILNRYAEQCLAELTRQDESE